MLIRTLFLLALLLPTLSQAADEKYYSVRPDDRECAAPLCGGVYVQELNQADTLCPDNESRTQCYIADIDWSALQLNDDQTGIAQNLARSGRAILRGDLGEKQFGQIGMLGELQVSEAWEAATGSPTSGTFYHVASRSNVVCLSAVGVPCYKMDAEELNTDAQPVPIELRLSRVGASQDKLDAAAEQLPNGVLVAGYIKLASSGPVRGYTSQLARYNTLSATQFYLPFAAETADSSSAAQEPCYVGGCSGQVCSDTQDVVTTCEYRPEYACYRTATCERQPDGNCGWTPTSQLNSCLTHNGLDLSPAGFPFDGFSLGGFTFPRNDANQYSLNNDR